MLEQDLSRIGVEIDDFSQLDLAADDSINLAGRVIDVECYHEDYQGKTRERWRIARPAPKKMTLDAVRALAARARVKAVATTPPPPPLTPPPEPDTV